LLKEDVGDLGANGVPLYTHQMNIDESLKELREKLRKRHEEIKSFLCKQEELCTELEEKQRPLSSDPLPSDAEMDEFAEHLYALNELKNNRMEEISTLQEDTKNIVRKLELLVLGDHDNNLLNFCLKPTKANIQELQQLFMMFNEQHKRMKYQIEDMRKRLTQLWKYLDVPESHQKKFDAFTDITQTTYDELHFEVKRCEQIKKENIRVFIEKVRLEIEHYWNLCLKSDTERARFRSFTSNTYNEDVLELHEDELRDLKMFYENNESLFKMVEERTNLWNQMELLQNKEQDPKRYANRGGQLLKEEKERRMISIKLPKIEAKLLEMVQQFERENNKQFKIFGAPIQDIIERDYDKKRQEKLTKSGKKIAATPIKTPSKINMTSMRTPLTVEQTIINRTNIKSTGGKFKFQQKTLSTTASSNASSVSSVRTENGKRKVISQPMSAPPAKRKLLSAFVSPAPPRSVLKTVSDNKAANASRKQPVKNASIKVYNVGSVIKRNSISRKSMSKKRRSSIKHRKLPLVVLSPAHSDEDKNMTDYENFEVRGQKDITHHKERHSLLT
jgi:protein regulator of cytokinesis 1